MQRILIADVETTGFSSKDGIAELAFIEIGEDMNETMRFESLINPGCPMSPGASAVNGITDEDVADSPTMEEILQRFDPNYFEDVFLIAHNASFDRRFLNKFWTITGELCTLEAARQIYHGAENHKLQTLCYELDLNDITKRNRSDILAHSAMSDVEDLFALLKRMTNDTREILPSFHEGVYKPQKITIMPFGKHKGSKLKEVPKKYLEWVLTLDNLDNDLKNAILKLN